MQVNRICTKCNVPVAPDFQFCNICGTLVESARTCGKCHALLSVDSKFCPECGSKVIESTVLSSIHVAGLTGYAGFWKRAAAVSIDVIILLLVTIPVSLVVGALVDNGGDGAGVSSVICIVINWVYFASMESSAKQATLGKSLLKIKVTDLDGNRIGFGKASVRHFGKILSSLLLCFGFIMIAFTKNKQGLHDNLAGCLVVNS